MRGKICQWEDNKGFGFILSDDVTEKMFFHISSVKTHAKRPQVGDSVLFEPARDSQNRFKAKNVVIEGVVAQSSPNSQFSGSQITSPKKNIIDYLLIFVLLGSLAGAGFMIYQTGSIEKALPYGIAAAVAAILLCRQKKTKG